MQSDNQLNKIVSIKQLSCPKCCELTSYVFVRVGVLVLLFALIATPSFAQSARPTARDIFELRGACIELGEKMKQEDLEWEKQHGGRGY
jgi:hypothetical protein